MLPKALSGKAASEWHARRAEAELPEEEAKQKRKEGRDVKKAKHEEEKENGKLYQMK